MIQLSDEVKDEFLLFARENNNIEVCALVMGSEQKQMIYKCENTHETPETDFRISAEQYAEAEDSGEVLMVIHSHNGDGARAIFSEMDIQGCNHSALPWGLVATESGEWNFLDYGNYSLIGRQFNLGTDDCYGLVMAWHETQGVKLEDFRVNYPWWERGENLYIDNLEKAGFVDSPMMAGCMVVMQVQSSVANHAGIITENGDLLHHLYGRLSEVTPFKSGYFRDRMIRCVRHKDLPMEIKEWNK